MVSIPLGSAVPGPRSAGSAQVLACGDKIDRLRTSAYPVQATVSMRLLPPVMFACLFLGIPACASSSTDARSDGSAVTGGKSAPKDGKAKLGGGVTGVDIQKISVNQAVDIPLMKDGKAPTPRNAPVIAGRPGVFRVFVAPREGWVPHTIVARLELGGSHPATFDASLNLSAASKDEDLASTFTIDLPADALHADTTYRVSLFESEVGKGGANGARYPESDPAPLEAHESAPLLLRVVPVVVSGIVPDTGPENLRALHDGFMRLYPVPDVKIDVREPLTWTGSPVEWLADGTEVPDGGLLGISGLVERTFASDPDAKGMAYLGIAAHTRKETVESPQTFGPGGFGGLQGVATVEGFWPEGGESVPGCDSVCGTIVVSVHEVGHVRGLDHTGYGTDPTNAVDPNYPHKDGTTGVWGYDILDRVLVPPTRIDMMGYGDVQPWISDYNYAKLFAASIASP